MGLAMLYNTWSDPQTLAEWSFNHAANHRDIVRSIFAKHNQELAEYPLDPMNPNDMAFWEYQHALMHIEMNAVLGIAGQNLTGVDWNDPQALSEFIDANADEHLQASKILGIS